MRAPAQCCERHLADMTTHWIALAFVLHACTALASPPPQCSVAVNTTLGLVCGVLRHAEGVPYASFRGVPYAKQPVGELRFKELEPAERWDVLYATTEGPICLQTDVVYGKIIKDSLQDQSEACIYANIHVPADALPPIGRRPVRELPPLYPEPEPSTGLPILVFIHGGGFAFGSGNTDLHGPEYLVSKKVIVITFNYRLNVFGFLSMNTAKIPGNLGLRDQLTLLNWVQRNARAFGGDPDDVTIGGQSAGATAAHLLTLSKATEGKRLFKRAILMSGTAASTFFSPSQEFAQIMSKQLLTFLGITSTDPDEIHRQLITLDAEKLKTANEVFLENIGLTTFVPTIESPLPGVTTIIDNDPDILIANGRGKNIPLLIGYTTAECETFRRRLEKFDIVKKIKQNPTLIVPPKTIFTTPQKFLIDLTKKIDRKYYNGTTNLNKFVKECTEGFYEYPALKLAQTRAETGGAPVHLYRFAYEGQSNIIKEVMGLDYRGVGHIEDLTYVFKVNSILDAPDAIQPSEDDICMKNLMTDFFVNFMACSKPICEDPYSLWPANNGRQVEDIVSPTVIQSQELSARQQDVVDFYDSLASRKGLT